MDWCRVVGPRGLCRPLDEKQVSNKQPGPRALSGLLDVLTQAGQGRAGGRGPGRGHGGRGQGAGGRGQGARGSGHVGTLSSAHANGQRRSRQFRV